MTTKTRKSEAPLAGTYPWLQMAPTIEESAAIADPEVPGILSPTIAAVPRVCLSRSEAAQALGIGVSTLKALEQEGMAPSSFMAPGGRRIYPVAGLFRWASERAGVPDVGPECREGIA